MAQEGGFLLSDPENYLREREKMNRDYSLPLLIWLLFQV